MSNNKDLFILIVLFGGALLTRVYGIWEWTLLGDEYYTVAFADQRTQSLINPAYYALVLVSRDLFGSEIWAARLPSVLFGAISIPLVYLLSLKFVGRTAALLASVFILFSDWHLYHSQLSRFYSGVLLFSLLAYFSYYKALIKDSYLLLGASFLFTGLAILFHATAVLVAVSCGVFSALVLAVRPLGEKVYARRMAVLYLAASVAGGLGLLPMLFGLSSEWSAQTYDIHGSVLRAYMGLAKELGIGLATAALFGTVLLLRDDWRKGTFVLVAIATPVIAWSVGLVLLPNVRERYIFFLLPLFALAAAYLCASIYHSTSRHRIAGVAVCAVLIVGMLPEFASYYTGKISLDIEDAIEAIQKQYRPGDVIVVTGDANQYVASMLIPGARIEIAHGEKKWARLAAELKDTDQRAWILLDRYRNTPLPKEKESWLLRNSDLIWRDYETSFGYDIMGFELYRVDHGRKPSKTLLIL